MSWAEVERAVEAVRARIGAARPRVGVVLGSGLGAYAYAHPGVAVPYGEIPGFPPVGVEGHAGRLVVTDRAAVLAGRAHFYEGHNLARVVLPVRMLVALGCDAMVLTNAAGGIRADLRPGDLVIVRDHLNLCGANPLRGPHDPRLGPRFPDMSEAYDRGLRAVAAREMQALGLGAAEGVYACMPGPSYETPAEIELLRRMGADLVGMSTVPEAIAARAMGARVLAISCVTNLAAGAGAPLSHDEVTATSERMRPVFVKLVDALVARIAAGPC